MPIYECYLLENSTGDNLHEMSKPIFLVNKIKKFRMKTAEIIFSQHAKH